MKSQTIHGNPLGEVVNPSSAIGFRLEDDHGNWIEARVIAGLLRVDVSAPLQPSYNIGSTITDVTGKQHKVAWVDHAGHGASDGDGPYDSDCGCRGTINQKMCASTGCGFCIAAEGQRPVRTIAEYMEATHEMWDHGHPTEQQLIDAAKKDD